MKLGRLLRSAVTALLALVLGYCALVVVLTLLYAVAPPVSTLMIGRWLTGQSVSRTAVPLEAISPYLPLAVISSEDARYCRHNGVDWDALREVIEEADEDGPSRGASTIPMQTAKNLFLWPGRLVVRKAMEIPIALFIDLVWTKRRLMENYLNMVEWGEGIFGAEAAAQHYFRKSARSLTRGEAALLATALPNPIARNPGRPRAGHRALGARLLARMAGGGEVAECVKG